MCAYNTYIFDYIRYTYTTRTSITNQKLSLNLFTFNESKTPKTYDKINFRFSSFHFSRWVTFESFKATWHSKTVVLPAIVSYPTDLDSLIVHQNLMSRKVLAPSRYKKLDKKRAVKEGKKLPMARLTTLPYMFSWPKKEETITRMDRWRKRVALK